MSIGPALIAGGLIGVRHALEADHLAAIATLADDRTRRPGVLGVSWGVGHSIPVVALGLLLVLAGVRLPEPVTRLFEAVVGVVLVVLGVRMLVGALGYHEHDHEDRGNHAHLQVGTLSIGVTHGHLALDGDSFLVGALHGFAGSGVLVIALASAAPTLEAAVAFLAGFSLLSIVTMGTASVVWERALEAAFETYLETLAGLVGIGVGALLLVEQLPGSGLSV